MRSKILSLKVWLLILVLISKKYSKSGASIACPKSFRFEKGSDVTFKCNITDNDVSEIYWFKGSFPHGDPILQMEDSKVGGTEYGKGHYRITNTGAMLIKDVKLEHEGFYNILVGNKRMQFVGDKIELKITVLPRPSCPLIRACSTCEGCNLLVNDNGNLTCEMNEIRPMIPIEWKIQSAQDVNITLYPQIATHDTRTDSWNVSATLSYMALSCNSSVSVQCKAEDDRQLLNYPVVSAFLRFDKKGLCSSGWLEKVQILIKPLILLAIVGLIPAYYLCLALLKKMKESKPHKENKQNNENFRTHKKSISSSSKEKPFRFVPRKTVQSTENQVLNCREDETYHTSKDPQMVIASSSTSNDSTVSNRSKTQQTMKQKLRKSRKSKR